MSFKFSSLKSEGSTVPGSNPGYFGADINGTKFIIPLNYGGLGYRFFDQLNNESDKVLQVDTINNITETKRAVKTRSVRLAIEMQARGVGKNDIILINSKTHAHQTIVLVATLFLGAIVCPINPDSPFKECLELVKKAKPKMCFCDSRTVSQMDRILLSLNITSEVVSFGDEVSATTKFVKLFPFKEDTNFKPFFVENPSKEVAFIVPTQGTCDEPKLVCLSHHNIYLQCLNFMEMLENPSKVISFFPLSWITQTIIACSSLEFGVTRIMAPSFNERTACKMIHDFVIDVAVLGSVLALRLTGNVAVKDFNLSCLKCAVVGVVNTSKNDLMQMRRVLPNVKFIQVYSLTETGLVAAVPAANYSEALERPTAVGKLLRNCKVKILDPETKQSVGPGQIGELYFHGDGLMLGYFKDNSRTIAAIEKGYFKTGDLTKHDGEGWLYLEGRIDDRIIFEDDIFLPRELEDCIVAHPQIRDACIIGNNTVLVACVQKKPDSKLTSDNILMYLSKVLPQYNNKLSEIVFLDEFPRTSAGNIKKRLLKEQYLKIKIEYTRSLASISASTFEEVSASQVQINPPPK
ncbi:hypothetical protein HUJ04_003989 [Dendroctonus ponderosae]|uniref:AMP-dependent synthetase/ligase domain-containing protein n=1 Tax=Dendroctonus ponderosae TaxID=77166 RepID=A0AAR5P9W4_DENPD|nr:hypothetical protein HUJ04_003989 [Dendroctonus ponderosae]